MAGFVKYDGVTYSKYYDYYDYTAFTFPAGGPSEITNNQNMINSGISADVLRKNKDSAFANLNFSGISVKSRQYRGIQTNRVWDRNVPDPPDEDYSNIGFYNQYQWPCTLITPKHVLISTHTWCEDWACPIQPDYGHGGNNIIRFQKETLNEDGTYTTDGVTAELDPSTFNVFPSVNPLISGSLTVNPDLAVMSLKEPITDPDVRIYPLLGSAIQDLSGISGATGVVGVSAESVDIPLGTVLFTQTSNGIMAYSTCTDNKQSTDFGTTGPDFSWNLDDNQSEVFLFLGDSNSPMILQSEKYGSVMGGLVLGAPSPSSMATRSLTSLLLTRLPTASIDQYVLDDGGYTLNWVHPSDLLQIQDFSVLGTANSYTPTTNMNAKVLTCKVTANGPRGSSTKTSTIACAASGATFVNDGYTGNVDLSSNPLFNTLYEETTLGYTKIVGNTAYRSEDQFPPVTSYSNINFAGTGPFLGLSGSLLDTGTNEIYSLSIPAGTSGLTIWTSFYMESLLGTTGDPNEYVSLGRIKPKGFGTTFDVNSFAWSTTSPESGKAVTGSVAGFTADPDSGSYYTALGIGFDFPFSVVESQYFTGATFEISIPEEADSGDQILLVQANYVNPYGGALGTAGVTLEIA